MAWTFYKRTVYAIAVLALAFHADHVHKAHPAMGLSLVNVNGAGDPWAALDGRNGHPAGTAQLPTLLNGYAVRPPWQVAGVDYYVGAPQSGVVYKVAGVDAAPSGVSVDTTNHIFTVTANNVTINGWDFTAAATSTAGYTIEIGSFHGTIISNSKWKPVGSSGTFITWNFGAGGNDTSATVTANTFDCNPSQNLGTNAIATSQQQFGAYTFTYNWYKDCTADGADFSAQNGLSSQVLVKYNLWDNASGQGDINSHADILTLGTSPITGYTSFIFDFNAVRCSTWGTQGNTGSQGVGWGGTLSAADSSTSYNTWTVTVASGLTHVWAGDESEWSSNMTNQFNYLDPTGFGTSNYQAIANPTGKFHASNNFNMLDGTKPAAWNGNF